MKLIFIIAAIIFGIRLICFLIAPFIPFTIYNFSPFERFDWNPAATIFGAVVTGGIAYYAVFKTSELDRKARVYEVNYRYFREQLFKLMDSLYPISKLSSKFKKLSHQNNPTSSAILQEDLFNYSAIENFIYVYDLINRINPRFTEKIEKYKTQVESLFDLRQYFCEKLTLHRYFIETKDDKYKVIFIEDIEGCGEKTIIHFSLNELLSSYKSEKNIDYDNLYTEECIKKIRDIITEQFKLEEK